MNFIFNLKLEARHGPLCQEKMDRYCRYIHNLGFLCLVFSVSVFIPDLNFFHPGSRNPDLHQRI
jgi:hypothetical protein